MKKLFVLLTLSLIIFPGICFAAIGDILYSNCADGGCTGAGLNNGWVRTVETANCSSGECLKLVGSWNGERYGAGNTAMSTGSAVAGQKEITISYYVKFDQSARGINGANFKQIRPFCNKPNESGKYFIATIGGYTMSGTNDFYISNNTGTFVAESIWDPYDDDETWQGDPRFSLDNGDGTWRTGTASAIVGKFSQGGYNGFGTQWTKVTQWIKLPSSDSAYDGESKLWINDVLAWHLYNADSQDGAAGTFSAFTFYPSSEAKEPFEQWMDNMVIYEGYVPPNGEISDPIAQAPIAPTNFRLTN